MAIKIERNEDGNCIQFLGSKNPVYWNGCLNAEINASDSDSINIRNTSASTGLGRDYFEFFKYDYTEFVDADDNPFASAQECVDYINLKANIPREEILRQSSTFTQGYYSLLSDYYFTSGLPTETEVAVADIDTWLDVNLTIAPNNSNEGLFDFRPVAMGEAQLVGHTGLGTQATPFTFLLEGLELRSFCSFRASLGFVPDVDEGLLEARLLFQRHSGTTPSTDFDISESVMTMSQGADIEYLAEAFISFFIGDTIDTESIGDAGTFRFQIKSSVSGTLLMKALTLFINK